MPPRFKVVDMKITIIKNVLTDGSATFDLLIQNGGERITLNLIDTEEIAVNRATNNVHIALEKAVGNHVPWNDMIETDAGWAN